MLVSEMIQRLKLKDDRVASFIVSAYKDSDLLIFLNEAQNTYLRKVAEEIKSLGFQQTKTRLTDLRPWFKRETLITNVSTYNLGRELIITDDKWLILMASINYTYKGINQKSDVALSSIEDRSRYITTSRHIPSFNVPVMFDIGNSTLLVLGDIDTVLSSLLELHYLEKPKRFSLLESPPSDEINELDAPDVVCENIINIALEEVRKSREAQTFQLSKDTNQERI